MRDVVVFCSGALVAVLAVSFALRGYDVRPKDKGDDYSLIITLQDGNEYAAEYRVTREDCQAKLTELFGGPIKGVECKREE